MHPQQKLRVDWFVQNLMQYFHSLNQWLLQSYRLNEPGLLRLSWHKQKIHQCIQIHLKQLDLSNIPEQVFCFHADR